MDDAAELLELKKGDEKESGQNVIISTIFPHDLM